MNFKNQSENKIFLEYSVCFIRGQGFPWGSECLLALGVCLNRLQSYLLWAQSLCQLVSVVPRVSPPGKFSKRYICYVTVMSVITRWSACKCFFSFFIFANYQKDFVSSFRSTTSNRPTIITSVTATMIRGLNLNQ